MLAFGAWTHRWTCDDAFIDLHVVDNLLSGHGPVFNVGERVEVYTSPIWFGLLAVGGALTAPFSPKHLPSELSAVFLGIACGALGLACAGLGARNFWRRMGSRETVLPFGTLLVVALIPFWDFTTSGLESSLVFLWIGASFLGLTRLLTPEPTRPPPLLLAILLGAGPLVRPDLGLFSLLFLGTLVVCTPGIGRRLACLFAAAMLPAAYEVFRMGYFGALVPNTALAKEAWISNWHRGLYYLRDFSLTYQIWIPLALVLPLEALTLAKLTKQRAIRECLVFATPILGGLLYGLYVIRWGGDFLHARMLLPAFFAIVLPLGLVPAATFERASIVLVPWVLASAFLFQVPYTDQNYGVERGRMNYVVSAGVPHPVRFQDFKDWQWAADVLRIVKENRAGRPREQWVFLATNGRRLPATSFEPWFQSEIVDRRAAIGMYSFGGRQKVYVCDEHGLADAIGGHERYLRPGEKSGHDKLVDPAWCLGRILTRSAARDWTTTNPTRSAIEDVQAALECGELADLEASVVAPLDAHRFWQNFRMAPRLTRLLIPDDPALARATLCGPKPTQPAVPPRGVSPAQWYSSVSPALPHSAPPRTLRAMTQPMGAARSPFFMVHPPPQPRK